MPALMLINTVGLIKLRLLANGKWRISGDFPVKAKEPYS